MTKPLYILSRVELGPEDPDFRSVLTPMEARRLGRLLKRAVWTSRKALEQAGVDCPDAVITASDFGALSQSEDFLEALRDPEGTPRPTHFMQSTHNTIGSLIAMNLHCHGYNATYSHKGTSLQSALADAWMLIQEGQASTVLVGEFDEPSRYNLESADVALSMLVSDSWREGALLLNNPLEELL